MDCNRQETTSQPSAEKSSTAVKLIQAAALAAMLVPLGSVAAESATISCFYTPEFGGGTGCTDSSSSSNTFNFDGYKYILTFFDAEGDPYFGDSFEITITDVLIDPFFDSEIMTGFSESLPGDYNCLLISADGTQCVEFQIFQSSGDPSPWATYTMTIAWLAPTPVNGSPDIPRVLERPSLDAGDPFVLDMCFGVPCVFTPGFADPEISSGDTDFSTQIPVVLQVAEPATLLLLAGGLGGIIYRRLRRRLEQGS